MFKIQLWFLVWRDSPFVNHGIQVNEDFCQVHKSKFHNLFALFHSDHYFCKVLPLRKIFAYVCNETKFLFYEIERSLTQKLRTNLCQARAWVLLLLKGFTETMMMTQMKKHLLQDKHPLVMVAMTTTVVWAEKSMGSAVTKKAAVLIVYWPKASQQQQQWRATAVFIWTRDMVAPCLEFFPAP